MPVVSVIMPAYNAERTIGRAIDSVLAQTFSDFELIIVDDGSKDGTLEIIKSYNDNRIVILSQKNFGPSTARNNGIKNSKGEYICFIDSDDWYEVNYLEQMISACTKDTDMVICNVVDHHFNYSSKSNIESNYFTNIFNDTKFLSLLKTGIIAPCWNKLYRKNIIINNRLTFDEYYFAEDIKFNLSYLKNVKGVKLIDPPLYNYDHINSHVTTKCEFEHFDVYISIHQHLLNFTKCNFINEINDFIYPQYIAIALKLIRKAATENINKHHIYKRLSTYLDSPLIRETILNSKNNTYKEKIINILLSLHLYWPINIYLKRNIWA